MTTPIPAAVTVSELPAETTPVPQPTRTYALKQVVVDLDKRTLRGKTHYLTVARGLTWQDAKSRRNANRKAGLSIVPERAG